MSSLLPEISFENVVTEPTELIRRRFQKPKKTTEPISKDAEDQLTYYSVSMCHVIRSAMWKLGGDLTKVSEMLSIPIETLQYWKRKFPEFKQACQEGQERSTQEIENALRGCAVPHDEVLEEYIPGKDDENLILSKTVRKDVVDVKAAIAVLKAKGDADWKNSKGTGGGVTGTKIQVNFNSYAPGTQTQPATVTVKAKPIETDEDPDGSD